MAHLYLYMSMAIGIAQIVDAMFLLEKKGRVDFPIIAFSMVECGWAAVSIVVILRSGAYKMIPDWLPISFVVYFAVMFLFGLWMVRGKKFDKALSLPRWSIFCGGIFGAYFFGASTYITLAV